MPTSPERLLALFAGNEAAHGTHGEPDWDAAKGKWAIRRTAKSLRLPATADLWAQHVAGTRPLGVVPVLNDGTCTWGSIDVDEYDADVLKLVSEVERAKLPLVPCRSKSGGLHLFLFLDRPTPAADVIATLRDVAARLGVAGSEIFPKQSQVLAERGDVGSWIVMPYFGGDFGGKLRAQVGLRKTGGEMSLEEFLDLAERSRQTPEQFATLRDRRGRKAAASNGAPFADGPPCLQHLAGAGVAPGGQNNTLLMMGIYYKRKSPGGWRVLLEQANEQFLQPPGSAEGLQHVISSLERKDYEYTCKVEPMCSHCDSGTCMTRKFGVGDGGNFPRISSISKLNIEPPIWFIDVEDRRLELSTEDLQLYVKFHRACMERLDRSYSLMNQAAWMRVLNDAMQNVTIIDAPPDVDERERFREMLEEFLTNRQHGQQKEDLLTGRPWENAEESRYYFRLSDLQKFLAREGQRDVSRGRLARRLQGLGGSSKFFNIRGRGCNAWFVPSAVVGAAVEVPIPPHKETPI